MEFCLLLQNFPKIIHHLSPPLSYFGKTTNWKRNHNLQTPSHFSSNDRLLSHILGGQHAPKRFWAEETLWVTCENKKDEFSTPAPSVVTWPMKHKHKHRGCSFPAAQGTSDTNPTICAASEGWECGWRHLEMVPLRLVSEKHGIIFLFAILCSKPACLSFSPTQLPEKSFTSSQTRRTLSPSVLK